LETEVETEKRARPPRTFIVIGRPRSGLDPGRALAEQGALF